MTESTPTEDTTQELHPGVKTERKSKASITIITLLVVVSIALGAILAVTYNSRYNEGVEAGTAEGIELGRAEQIESITADRYKGAVGDLVGLNASQVGYISLADEWRIHVTPSQASVPLLFKTPNGESINGDNAQDYKVVAQEPKANTAFDITYQTNSDGEEFDSLLATSGVQKVTVTVEKVKQ